MVDRLELKGYLQRVSSLNDKRKKELKLTQSGINLAEEVIACAKEVNAELVKNMDCEEAKQLLKLLQKVNITFDD